MFKGKGDLMICLRTRRFRQILDDNNKRRRARQEIRDSIGPHKTETMAEEI
jgi:hypothetical protein